MAYVAILLMICITSHFKLVKSELSSENTEVLDTSPFYYQLDQSNREKISKSSYANSKGICKVRSVVSIKFSAFPDNAKSNFIGRNEYINNNRLVRASSLSKTDEFEGTELSKHALMISNPSLFVPSIAPSRSPSMKISAVSNPALTTTSTPTKNRSVSPSSHTTVKISNKPTAKSSITPSFSLSQSKSAVPSLSYRSIPLPITSPPFNVFSSSSYPSLKSSVPSLHLRSTPSPPPTLTSASYRPTRKIPSRLPTFSTSKKPPSFRPSKVPSLLPTTSKLPSATPTLGNDIQYHMGKTIITGTVNLYNIYYGNFVLPNYLQQTRRLIDYFSSTVGNSSWYKTLSEYYQVNRDGSKTYASTSVVLKKSINVFPGAKRITITDSDIVNVILAQFNSASKPLPVDTNGIYVVIFRGDFNYDGWLRSWCGFHSSFALSDGRMINFVVLGEPSTAPIELQPACVAIEAPTANGDLGGDSVVNIYGHELAEAVTDSSGAWFFESSTGYTGGVEEIADPCSWIFGVNSTTNWNTVVGNKRFLLQELWRPGYGCVVTCCLRL